MNTFLLSLFLILGLFPMSMKAQNNLPPYYREEFHSTDRSDTIIITATALAKGIRSDSLRFRFHAGDDMLWKETNFDDRAWQTVRNDTAGRILPSGISWFRTCIRAQADVVPTSASFNAFVVFGAAEIYLDGRLIYYNGKPAAAAQEEEIGRFTLAPTGVFITLSDTATHVLAARTSRWSLAGVKTWLGWSSWIRFNQDYGVLFMLKQAQATTKAAARGYQQAVIQSISFGVLFLLALLQGYLYALNRQDKTALYFALFVGTFWFFVSTHVVFYYAAGPQIFEAILQIVGAITSPLTAVFLLYGMEMYFKERIPLWYAGLVGLLAFADIMLNLLTNAQFVKNTAYILLCAEIIRSASVHAFRNRTNADARILGVGVASFGILAVLDLMRSFVSLGVWTDGFDLLFYTAVPIAMTSVFVRRTAQDRARLARYSQDLERDVAERTHELQAANEEISRQMEVQTEQAREIELTNTALQQAHEESETLLLNILPSPIAHRLKAGERAIADRFDAVTVLFADIVGFTKLSAQTTPEELVQGLNTIFGRFDELAKKYSLEKIKTIGDAYMVAGGLPERSQNHCERVAAFALEMQATMRDGDLRTNTGERVQLRIGIHTGEAVAGVIGTSKFAYDLWGDTVNTASRMESHGEAGKIHVSEEVYSLLKGKFTFEERGEMEIKGKGTMRTWFLVTTQPSQ